MLRNLLGFVSLFLVIYATPSVSHAQLWIDKDGAIDGSRLYESPFTGVTATGPDSIFPAATVKRLFDVINEVRIRAVA